jgi:predicted nucleotidyltransferase
VTGSHHYGFPSPDSDLDLKGIHLAPTESLLGLSPPPETHDRLEVFEGTECDLTTHEAQKALLLLLRGNGNMLERIFSPFQLDPSEELNGLRSLAKGALSRRFFGHYRGFLRGICNEHEKTGERRAKSLLYAYRVALTGTHLLNTGEVVGNLIDLAGQYGFPEALALAERKRAGAEKEALTAEEDERHRASWPRLLELLEGARASSPLPEDAPNQGELNAWLTDLRKRELLERG